MIIAVLVFAGYGFFLAFERSSQLVQLGLISFVAVAQFLPGIIGTLFWAGANRLGFIAGLTGMIVVSAQEVVQVMRLTVTKIVMVIVLARLLKMIVVYVQVEIVDMMLIAIKIVMGYVFCMLFQLHQNLLKQGRIKKLLLWEQIRCPQL